MLCKYFKLPYDNCLDCSNRKIRCVVINSRPNIIEMGLIISLHVLNLLKFCKLYVNAFRAGIPVCLKEIKIMGLNKIKTIIGYLMYRSKVINNNIKFIGNRHGSCDTMMCLLSGVVKTIDINFYQYH